MPKRKDATYVYNVNSFKKLFPYLMPRKCDSIVYLNFNFDLTKTLKFIKNNPSPTLKRKYRVFELLIASIIRLITIRPELNRFIMNKKLWQRNNISLNFIIKEDYKDESAEHSIILKFDSKMTLDEIANLVDKKIIENRNLQNKKKNNSTDKLVDIFTSFPPFITSFFVSFIKFLDIKGIAPLSITEEDGLHCTTYISNLGSIGLKNGVVQHHLYQWGSTSIFVTIGALKRKRVKTEKNTIKSVDSIDLGFSVDERIADGYYFIKSLNLFQEILNNPEQLVSPLEKIKKRPPKNRKEYKKSKVK